MSRRLSIQDQAYNACIDALNSAEKRLQDAAEDRDRAWLAAEALSPTTGHGAGLISQRRLAIVPLRRRQ